MNQQRNPSDADESNNKKQPDAPPVPHVIQASVEQAKMLDDDLQGTTDPVQQHLEKPRRRRAKRDS